MRAAVISFTENGDKLNERLGPALKGFETERCGKTFGGRSVSLGEWTRGKFNSCSLIIFIGAAGIAMRACAPYVRAKDKDPAVIVIDERGRYVIPLLSGHIGGANRLSRRLAEYLGADAVITTATDINGVWSVDEWAAENGYRIYDTGTIKYISAALLRGEPVGLVSSFEIKGDLPLGITASENTECGIYISDIPDAPFKYTLCLMPKRLIIGAGSKAGADRCALSELYEKIKTENAISAVPASVATIDIKANEPSVKSLAQHTGAELCTFTAEELNSVKGCFTASEFVRSVTGTDNVCERAAVICGERQGRKTDIIVKKTVGNGVTAALAVMDWSVVF